MSSRSRKTLEASRASCPISCEIGYEKCSLESPQSRKANFGHLWLWNSPFFSYRTPPLAQSVLPQGDFLTTILGTFQDWNSGYEVAFCEASSTDIPVREVTTDRNVRGTESAQSLTQNYRKSAWQNCRSQFQETDDARKTTDHLHHPRTAPEDLIDDLFAGDLPGGLADSASDHQPRRSRGSGGEHGFDRCQLSPEGCDFQC